MARSNVIPFPGKPRPAPTPSPEERADREAAHLLLWLDGRGPHPFAECPTFELITLNSAGERGFVTGNSKDGFRPTEKGLAWLREKYGR